jgi:DNA-binding IclR family transcriptional regulator
MFSWLNDEFGCNSSSARCLSRRFSLLRKNALHATPLTLRTPVRRPPRAAAAAPLVPAVSRALALLDRLALQREPMSLAQLTAELALPKSSVHGLCNTLMSFGYLKRQPDGAFLIGPRVMSLAEAFVSGTDVAQEFNALWADAGTAPEETVVLSVLSGTDALYVAVRNSARPLGLAFNVGMRLPAYLSGSGKAMLAYLPPDDLRRLFAAGLQTQLTRKGPRDIEALLKEMALTRKRGHSVDDETVREGVYSFGAPVFDASGQVVAGVAVCINKALLGADRSDRYRDAVLSVARTLSQRLGGEVPASAPAAGRQRKAVGNA